MDAHTNCSKNRLWCLLQIVWTQAEIYKVIVLTVGRSISAQLHGSTGNCNHFTSVPSYCSNNISMEWMMAFTICLAICSLSKFAKSNDSIWNAIALQPCNKTSYCLLWCGVLCESIGNKVKVKVLIAVNWWRWNTAHIDFFSKHFTISFSSAFSFLFVASFSYIRHSQNFRHLCNHQLVRLHLYKYMRCIRRALCTFVSYISFVLC